MNSGTTGLAGSLSFDISFTTQSAVLVLELSHPGARVGGDSRLEFLAGLGVPDTGP